MKKLIIICLTCILCNSCSILFDPLYEVIHQDGTDVVYYRYDRYYRPVPPPPRYHYHPVHPPKPKPPQHHKPKPAPPQHKPAPPHNGHKPTPPSRPQPKPNHNRR